MPDNDEFIIKEASECADHFIEEVEHFAKTLAIEIMPLLKKQDPTIIISSMNILLASIISHLINPKHLDIAIKGSCKALETNIDLFVKEGSPLFKKFPNHLDNN